MSTTSNNDTVKYKGKPLDSLTKSELKQALLKMYFDRNRFRDLYSSALNEKAKLTLDFISSNITQTKLSPYV